MHGGLSAVSVLPTAAVSSASVVQVRGATITPAPGTRHTARRLGGKAGLFAGFGGAGAGAGWGLGARRQGGGVFGLLHVGQLKLYVGHQDTNVPYDRG
jgi:hypothetical protein